MTAESAGANSIHEIVPLLYVDDMERSLDFYRGKLAFDLTLDWKPDGRVTWCRLERNGCALMLQQACDEDGPSAGRGRGVVFFFNGNDANAEYERLRSAGLTLDPPAVAFYGMNQLYLRDPDGYELCFQNPVATA